ncbi:DUF5615 family PIN-like protein [Aeoliella mucimassa]|uniref:DUF5615 domain-containing protein n=1 Tax=Aeoliella mucimassa TaxID=2527972 RepID=A0A518ALZ4_9BACT|nr:hypothetical protein Pan181_19440 [Aeoliella mucimassa]
MSVRLVIDMNLSPAWVEVLKNHGWDSIHWSDIGSPKAPDIDIMTWASANNCVVFTHDLDFGTALALTRATGPSVIQVRTQKIMPVDLESTIVTVLKQYESDLTEGALIVVDQNRLRVRILPL